MTTRKNVSQIQNKFHNAQRVDEGDLLVEQVHNTQIHSATIQNHFGSGVLLDKPRQYILFDSDNLDSTQAALDAVGVFDGSGIHVHTQPSDANLGNQIEVELTDSTVKGRFSVKVAIIGLDFEGNLQYDKFYFHKNEKQITSRHYARILALFFNDFKGNNNCSRNHGGRIVIRETAPFQLSRDDLMAVQDVEPDIFWRDFKFNQFANLFTTIQQAIGSEYDADALNINITGKGVRTLSAGDVTSQIGQKFLASTDNIQKVTLLLGVNRNDTVPIENRYDWLGDLVISIYPLQTTVSCPSAIVPNLAIDYDPAITPLAQITYSQAELLDLGYVLTDTLQPVDFIFSETKLGNGSTSGITIDNYYAVTIKRSGAAATGNIIVSVANDRIEDSRLIAFNGIWTDVTEEDLWFKIWTDAAKIADGRGYDNGNGIEYEKTTTDPDTAATIDNKIVSKSFIDTGENILNTGIIQAVEYESYNIQDERAGNTIFSRKKYIPSFSFVDNANLTDLRATSEPFVIGTIRDTNPKLNELLTKTQTFPGLARADTFCIINPDADLLSVNVVGSKIYPNTLHTNNFRIFGAQYCYDGYGDVNGDGIIDDDDISAVSSLLGESLFYSTTQQKIIDGYFSTFEILRADVDGDGYVSSTDLDLITRYVNRQINSFPVGTYFTHLCLTLQQSVARWDGYFDCADGYVRLDGYAGVQLIPVSSLSDTELRYYGYLVTPQLETDPIFTTVPFPGVTYEVIPQPYWQGFNIIESSNSKLVTCSFTTDNDNTIPDCTMAVTFSCEDRGNPTIICDPGKNDLFIPGNLILNDGSKIVDRDGYSYKHDIEIGTIILNLPNDPLQEVTLNVFNKLIADSGDGLTSAGFAAMRYADCSTVQPQDLALGKLKFSVSIQAMVPELDGYDGYLGNNCIIIDDIVGVYFDHDSGILTLTSKDMHEDTVYKSLVTKIQIIVYLKKAGWRDSNYLEVQPAQLAGLLSS